jgi:hypothetical protein
MTSLGQQVWSGILFNATLLSEPWFLLLTAFVSFNTIVFVGLSFGKILYWPKERIRPIRRSANMDTAKES